MKKKLIIIGSGLQAKILALEIIYSKKVNLIGFFDKKNKKLKKITVEKKQIPIYSKMQKVKNIFFIIAIGDNFTREKIKNEMETQYKKINWYTYISNETLISKNNLIGKGTIVMKGSIINSNCKIGEHCLINTGSIVEHDNIFKDFSSIAPGAITNGSVILKERSHIGSGSVIKNNIKIEKDVVIGIGSVVTRNCGSKKIYFGNPAKSIRRRKINEKYL